VHRLWRITFRRCRPGAPAPCSLKRALRAKAATLLLDAVPLYMPNSPFISGFLNMSGHPCRKPWALLLLL
jgi:hypothetical protein